MVCEEARCEARFEVKGGGGGIEKGGGGVARGERERTLFYIKGL